MKFSYIATLLVATFSLHTSFAESKTLTIHADKKGAEIQPTMYGLFFEDINFAADGGLYAELVKNRSFEFPQHFMGWNIFGDVELMNDGPFERNPRYVRLSSMHHSHKHTGLENEGFFGIGVKKGAEYRLSFWARGEGGKLRVELIKNNTSADNQAFVWVDVNIESSEWKKYEVSITSPITEPKSHLRIFLTSKERVDLEHVSLFPADTWRGREGGLRRDLVQALYDLKPGVFRFPGGCIVEGTELEDRYQWKNTVGIVENRPLNLNRWHYTFRHRFFPDYFQSGGLGFYEYFLLSEDIGAEPLPILNCGLVCQYQNKDEKAHVALCDLQPYIQDAIDLIEFANGDTSTKWGALRAEMGHEAPFNLKYVGIGNEQWGKLYPERLALFVEALRKAHPEIKIVGSSGPHPDGREFDYLWAEMTKLGVDLVDEHFYRPEEWFLKAGTRYDNYDREAPKVFAGEYACHGKGKKWNHFNAALMEAAFMTCLERNADVVTMATYAPLFAHTEGWQWRPDMIWFDNLRMAKSCSYYVQQLYSLNAGTHTLPLLMNGEVVAGKGNQEGLFASAVYDSQCGEYIVKIINTSESAHSINLRFEGLKKGESLVGGICTTLHSDNPDADNTVDNPTAITPQTYSIEASGREFECEVAAKIFALYRFSVKRR